MNEEQQTQIPQVAKGGRGIKIVGVVIGALILVAAGAFGADYYYGHGGVPLTAREALEQISTMPQFVDAGKNAFGSLANSTNVPSGTNTMLATRDSVNPGMAMSTGVVMTEPTAMGGNVMYGEGGMGAGGDAKIGIVPPYFQYKFVYKGDSFNQADTSADVYKRTKSTVNASAVSNILKSAGLGLLNLTKFQNPQLQSFSLLEDRDFGYIVTVNAQEGSAYINENWEKWNSPDRQCTTTECFDQYRLKESDVPSDSDIIGIANNFLGDYGISTAGYGNPVVQKYWQNPGIMYEGQPQTDVYIPEVISVIYPLHIQDKNVSDESGNPTGLNVMVNIRQKKASGVYDLYAQNFQSSSYGLETDTKRLIKFAENGGGYMYPNENANAEVYLGTPTRGLARMWIYSNNTSQELFVPVLVFPVTGTSNKTEYYQKQVIVPLVKEILDDREKQQNPQPIPYDTGAPGMMMKGIEVAPPTKSSR